MVTEFFIIFITQGLHKEFYQHVSILKNVLDLISNWNIDLNMSETMSGWYILHWNSRGTKFKLCNLIQSAMPKFQYSFLIHGVGCKQLILALSIIEQPNFKLMVPWKGETEVY